MVSDANVKINIRLKFKCVVFKTCYQLNDYEHARVLKGHYIKMSFATLSGKVY